jgi:hypothetical protein
MHERAPHRRRLSRPGRARATMKRGLTFVSGLPHEPAEHLACKSKNDSREEDGHEIRSDISRQGHRLGELELESRPTPEDSPPAPHPAPPEDEYLIRLRSERRGHAAGPRQGAGPRAIEGR